jgi:hypothetical protein
MVSVQLPSGAQQAPLAGMGQGFGSHGTSSNQSLKGQLTCVSSVHVPSGAQQAPIGTSHGFGSQVMPAIQYFPPDRVQISSSRYPQV